MSAVGVSARFTVLRTWFDVLAMRERLLIAITALAVIWVVWSFGIQQFIDERRQAATNGVGSVQAQIQAAITEQRLLSGNRSTDPDEMLRDKRDVLLQALESLETRLERAVDSFVAPERMPELLSEVMREHDGLSFTSVTRLPSEPLIARNEDAVVELDVPSLYRHPLRIDFEGTYFDVLSYLAALESSDWRLNWRSLNYEVAAYPNARVSVEVDTLSRQREWLGV